MVSWHNCLRCLGIWRRIFLRSAMTGATHVGDQVPSRYWKWPKDTYLQRRLEYLKRSLYPKSVPDRSRELRSIDEQTDSGRANLQPRPSTIRIIPWTRIIVSKHQIAAPSSSSADSTETPCRHWPALSKEFRSENSGNDGFSVA
jgi:hypothetical protein